jgi:hypothetical protein
MIKLERCNMSDTKNENVIMIGDETEDEKIDTYLHCLGGPPLTARDNEEDYKAIHKEVADHVQPQDFAGKLKVRDITDAIWEEQRCKRYQTKLIDSAFHTAVINTLTQIHKTDEWLARANAEDFLDGMVEEKKRVADLLQRYGVGTETLYAVAMSLNAQPISVLERMIENRKSSRSKLLKDNEHEELLELREQSMSLSFGPIGP